LQIIKLFRSMRPEEICIQWSKRKRSKSHYSKNKRFESWHGSFVWQLITCMRITLFTVILKRLTYLLGKINNSRYYILPFNNCVKLGDLGVSKIVEKINAF